MQIGKKTGGVLSVLPVNLYNWHDRQGKKKTCPHKMIRSETEGYSLDYTGSCSPKASA